MLCPLLSALLAGAFAASPVYMEAPALDRLFDGKKALPRLDAVALRQSRPILRAEDDPLPPAPRFALDVGAIPPGMARTIPGYDRLFHKNQEETATWVERVNALIRAGGGKVPEWTYDGRPNEPPFTCLSDAAGTVNDWWALQLGRELPVYTSANNGALEQGLDPRLLELKYFERAKTGDPDYFLLPGFIEKDPVRNISSPQQPRGFAELLLEDESYEVSDPVTGRKYSWDPGMSAMEGQYVQLFTNSLLRPRTPDKYAKVLAEAVEKWGIAYVQLEHTQHPRLSGAHTVAVVGYFCMEDSGQAVDCGTLKTDKDWGAKAYFMAHDSFGDFPASKPRDASGGSAYRAVRIGSIDQAIVFPHSLTVAVEPAPDEPGAWVIQVTNKGGRPVQVLDITGSPQVSRGPDGSYRVKGAPGEAVRVDVAAKHYFEADGKARSFALKLGQGPAMELVRTSMNTLSASGEENRLSP
ncbi:MAG: hypothetical protein WC728_13620 [Elusimicrobiota bacterium]